MSKIAILAPSPIRGSGGVARIYTYAQVLNLDGHQCDIYVFDSGNRSSSEIIRDADNFYSVNGVRITPGLNIDEDYDLIIATRWDTAIIVRDIRARKKAYLVQDFEACFNPVGDGTILAENSYLYGLQPITYGRWLALKLHREFGNAPYYCNFASDLGTFRANQQMRDRLDRPPAICFIYQHDKPRRCPHLGIEALGIVKHMRPDVEIYFVGSNEAPKLWYDYTNVGLLNTEGLNDLYNRCHVGFCLSSSNPSCNAFDMMAAGLPSVDLYRENNLFDIPSGGVLLAHQTPESLAEAILYLLSNPKTLLQMSDFGIEFMKTRSAEDESKEFLTAINDILSDKPFTFDVREVMQECYAGEAVIASACLNSSVVQHVHSQLDKYTNLTSEAVRGDRTGATFKSHSYVTTLNQKNTYPAVINMSFISRLMRFIKRLIKHVGVK